MIRSALFGGALGAALGAALWPAAAPARAAVEYQVRDAGDLAALCAGQQPAGAARDGAVDFCHGYAQGVVSLELEHAKKPFCMPSPPPARSATLAEFATWVRGNDQRAAMGAPAALLGFLKERFPCT